MTQTKGGENVLTCSICMDYIISCRTALCGHSFCEICINEALIRKKECPNCRKDIRKWGLNKSNLVDSAVTNMINLKKEERDEAEYKRHQDRLKNHNEWKDKHAVKEVKPGDMLDVLDTEYVWCKATVELKIRSQGRQPLLFIHYEVSIQSYLDFDFVLGMEP